MQGEKKSAVLKRAQKWQGFSKRRPTVSRVKRVFVSCRPAEQRTGSPVRRELLLFTGLFEMGRQMSQLLATCTGDPDFKWRTEWRVERPLEEQEPAGFRRKNRRAARCFRFGAHSRRWKQNCLNLPAD